MVSPLRLHWIQGVGMFRCNLPHVLLREWPGSFTCHCSKMGAEQTLNKSQHMKLTLEKKFLAPPLPGFELATFWSWVWRSYQQAILAPYISSSRVVTNQHAVYKFWWPMGCRSFILSQSDQAQICEVIQTTKIQCVLYGVTLLVAWLCTAKDLNWHGTGKALAKINAQSTYSNITLSLVFVVFVFL